MKSACSVNATVGRPIFDGGPGESGSGPDGSGPGRGCRARGVADSAAEGWELAGRLTACHLGDPVIDKVHKGRAGLGRQVFGFEELPVGVLDFGLHPGGDLGQDVPRPVDETALT